MSDPRDWDLEYDGAAPPLPRQMERNLGAKWRPWPSIVQFFFPRRAGQGERQWAELIQRLLPTGAYLIWFKPRIAWIGTVEPPMVLAGVLRIHHSVKGRKLISSGSGDLYLYSKDHIPDLVRALEPLDERGRLQMLQFPRSNYRYYLRLETLWVLYQDRSRHEPGWPLDESVILGFDTYRFLNNKEGWQRRQPITIRVDLKEGRSPELCTSGNFEELPYPAHVALNSLENHIGDVHLVRVARIFRHAEIEVHATEGIYSPRRRKINGKDLKEYEIMFNEVLNGVGWAVDLVDGSSIAIADVPRGKKWTQRNLREYHEKHIDGGAAATAMGVTKSKASRGDHSPQNHKEGEWRYHLLLVEHLEWGTTGRPLGLMYDVDDGGSDDLPRQGAAIALKAQTRFKGSEGQLQSFPSLLSRTVLHEVGHMQGLYHNPSSRGVMQPRDYFSKDFGGKEDMVHSDVDGLRLSHLPDPWVRPGGVPFGYRYRPSAVDIFDLIPTNFKFEELTAHPHALVMGERPELTIYSVLENRSGTGLLCPPNDDVSQYSAYFGALLRSPSGKEEEVLRILLPKRLGDNSWILHGRRKTYEVPLGEAMPVLREAGTYDLEVHLSWAATYDSGQSFEIYRAHGVVELQVGIGVDISQLGGRTRSRSEQNKKGVPDGRVSI